MRGRGRGSWNARMLFSCPNPVQIVFFLGKSIDMTGLHNCVKDSYACCTRGSIFAGACDLRAVVGITGAICARPLASLMNHQLIDKLC